MTKIDQKFYIKAMVTLVLILCLGAICTFMTMKAVETTDNEETEQITVHMKDVNYWTVVDEDTKIVYIFSTSYGIFPYLSENGKYMRFIDGEYVKVE